MKKVMIVGVMLLSTLAFAQNKVDEERMQRDIEVAENILGTLIKQELGKRDFFPIEVEGSYLPGYGVTFHLPNQFWGDVFFIDSNREGFNIEIPQEPVMPGEPPHPVKSYSYSYSTSDGNEERVAPKNKTKTKVSRNRSNNADSALMMYNDHLLLAAKNFIADYGDLLSQLQLNEKIVVTNKSDRRNYRMVYLGSMKKEKLLTVEGTKSDINQFRQGKINRDQLLNKFHVMNSEVSDELHPDLETLSSIFNRLYSRDLSKTFFCDDNIYFEKLKDYGALYHMQVFASTQMNGWDEVRYEMPTVRMTDLDQVTRDKKVKEMYPQFEKSIREDILEYGRTLKSLTDDEVLVFDITMTRCKGCAIPSSIELSVKSSVLKDYSSGKISKDAALAKMNMKKGPDQ